MNKSLRLSQIVLNDDHESLGFIRCESEHDGSDIVRFYQKKKVNARQKATLWLNNHTHKEYIKVQAIIIYFGPSQDPDFTGKQITSRSIDLFIKGGVK